MREILFRGKSAVKGEWIERYYFKARIGGKAIHCILPYGDFVERVMGLREGRIYQIIPETKGEFTGLTDKNGTKIFEGDIVQLDSMRYAVEWRTDGWIFRCIEPKTWSSPYFGSHAQSAKVIGNIHDNPEMLIE